ncbi:MAG: 23S rRNA (pseudouridine(1915)-N(3))-methyltransferase RlmH [Ruminococcaceae bacterium]|nr:23S rRNA (pseudouridine(1915)-N(3))-methyltransferase RlmH [Oscillospiraceae bacterium]
MLKIKIITVGKIKSKELKSVIAEYEKRTGRYAKFEAVEINDLPLSEKPSQSEINTCLEKEAVDIEKKISDKAYIISLCIEGKKLDSEGFSKKIASLSQSYSEICFIIGSSHGISENIKKKSHFLLSMSDMTFPHNLARLMLTEQVYRAFKIASNESYHK